MVVGTRELSKKFGERVDLMPEALFPSRNIFCMVGTNRSDYEAALGAARTFVGPGSAGPSTGFEAGHPGPLAKQDGDGRDKSPV